ncbi:transcriptional regulator [Acidithiobacillus ferriphilus]|uniref:transcriptional regulator n=1 Tax=Acidithiobacillus ferriphilus TaxID=1689834 RepID=UPI001C075E9D|nr:YdaS family helix-turn-helix protein [Acidithiobacillus ferriphilus]MBU2854744.1 helix-turn-helix domain-containing protein [Acidithiobacillus ferriphilus]
MNILKEARHPLSRRVFARKMGVSAEAVRKWELLLDKGASIPAGRVLPLVRATEYRISPHELRPDLYPDPNWVPFGAETRVKGEML